MAATGIAVVSARNPVHAHCQVPCGIFDVGAVAVVLLCLVLILCFMCAQDSHRMKQLFEDARTVRKVCLLPAEAMSNLTPLRHRRMRSFR